jgi:hypothetical protein
MDMRKAVTAAVIIEVVLELAAYEEPYGKVGGG